MRLVRKHLCSSCWIVTALIQFCAPMNLELLAIDQSTMMYIYAMLCLQLFLYLPMHNEFSFTNTKNTSYWASYCHRK